MSEHRATIRWQNSGATLDYAHFSRDHTWTVKEGRLTVPASSAPAYQGNADLMDPEDALVAALADILHYTQLSPAAPDASLITQHITTLRQHLQR